MASGGDDGEVRLCSFESSEPRDYEGTSPFTRISAEMLRMSV